MSYIFWGAIVHSKSFDDLEIITNGFVVVDDGIILAIGSLEDYDKWAKSVDNVHRYTEYKLTEHQFLMPGLIDCHIHAPQMPNIGLGLDKGLLDWLQTYTFPLESKYSDVKFAQHVYEKVVKRTLKSGTTLACYYGTNYKDSTLVLAKEAIKMGQRAFIGKVSSNCSCPSFYVETTNESIKANQEFVDEVLNLKSSLVKPIITPRFALSCDLPLMKALGELAKKHDLHIQSHLSESLGEIEAIKEVYKKKYAQVYEEANLLTNKCIMAHCVHLDDEEIKILKRHGTSVAHCPASNTNLGSGLCDVKRLLEGGIKVGLGTDVSGGNRASILDAIRDALNVSKHIYFAKTQEIKGTGKLDSKDAVKSSTYTPINYKQAIYLATLGGAEALAMSQKIGNFVIGKQFDALFIDVNQSPLDLYNLPAEIQNNKSPTDKILEMVQKFIYTGDDRNIFDVFVNGATVIHHLQN